LITRNILKKYKKIILANKISIQVNFINKKSNEKEDYLFLANTKLFTKKIENNLNKLGYFIDGIKVFSSRLNTAYFPKEKVKTYVYRENIYYKNNNLNIENISQLEQVLDQVFTSILVKEI
jgi:hypothetical protein